MDKNGATIASAVTNLDLHDIARTAKTFGVKSFYVVTPLVDQKVLVERIVDHWISGAGARYNPKRRQALELVKISDNLEQVVADIESKTHQKPKTIATSARNATDKIDFNRLRQKLQSGLPHLLIFGTAWGLSGELIQKVDYRLPPITGPSDYNHLSVRCAAAIIMDRLLAG